MIDLCLALKVKEQVESLLECLNQSQENLGAFIATADDLDTWSQDAVADLEKVKTDVATSDNLDEIATEFEVRLTVKMSAMIIVSS